MDPVARQAHDDVSGSDRPSFHDLRLPDDAEAGAREVELAHELGYDGDFPTNDRDVRHLRSAVQPDADLTGYLAVVRFDRDVVHEGDRLGADADHVVHVHRDAIDPDRVPTAHLLGDEDLGPNAIRAQGECVRAEVDEAREMSDLRKRLAKPST